VSTAFVSQLRTNRPPILITPPGAGTITLRVEIAEIWETVRVVADPETTVADVKQRVVTDLFPTHGFLDEFVLKLRGWEMLDEQQPLSKAGVVDGSILLLAYRRRRPVR
jgi:hypothetical protein